MTELRQLYYCEICGNVVQVVHTGAPALVCCDQPMTKLDAKTQDEGKEKHVPVTENIDNGVKVNVGSVDHPMVEEHYIQFIEVLTEDKVLRHELEPGQPPSATFNVNPEDIQEVRIYCNVHSLWKA